MPPSPADMLKSMITNMPEKTGKSLDQWLVITRHSGLEKHGQIVKLLKNDYAMTHGFANMVAHHTLKSDEVVDLVAAQYSGGKSGLRPLHDILIKHAQKFGSDVEISPKKTCVSLRRSKQFAVITPATKTRIDLGINLKGFAGSSRLLKQTNAMCTHKIQITQISQIDQQLLNWLQQAYDLA